MAEPLTRVTYPDPMCTCGETEAVHLVLPGGRRGACTHMDPERTCRCERFTPAAAKAGEC